MFVESSQDFILGFSNNHNPKLCPLSQCDDAFSWSTEIFTGDIFPVTARSWLLHSLRSSWANWSSCALRDNWFFSISAKLAWCSINVTWSLRLARSRPNSVLNVFHVEWKSCLQAVDDISQLFRHATRRRLTFSSKNNQSTSVKLEYVFVYIA